MTFEHIIIINVLLKLAKMEDTKSELNLKTKISFSVESLLSSKPQSSPKYDRNEESTENDEERCDFTDRLKSMDSSACDDEDDGENITVDEDTDDLESRESLSPNSTSHTVIVPQPLHPSMPRILSQGPPPHWGFPWVGHNGMLRSSSPQSRCCNSVATLEKLFRMSYQVQN